jgi:ABC-type multidrug transport system ATPase subunit
MVNGRKTSMKDFFENKQEYLPNHVFGYYSGPTNRLAQHFIHHQKLFYDQQRSPDNQEDRPLRPLFFALPVHSQFVLLAFFTFPDVEDREILRDYIGIAELDSVRFVIREPDWARTSSSNDPFWGATGIPRELLKNLYREAKAPIREDVRVPLRTGRSRAEEHLHLYFDDINALRRVAHREGSADFQKREFFKDLDTLFISTLIHEIQVSVKIIDSDEVITFSELSEGEQQLLTLLGLLKFTSDVETLFLLDEPDTHLNPAWKLDLLRLVEPIVGDDTQCQLLLVTHDPIVIGSCVKEQVRVLDFETGLHSGDIIWREPKEDPQGMGVAALLTSDVYGLRSSLDWVTQKKLDEKRDLVAKLSEELSPSDRKVTELRLEGLNAELSELGFNYSFRDPMYEEFSRLMAIELESYPELTEQTLTKEQQEKREEIAKDVIARVKSERENNK